MFGGSSSSQSKKQGIDPAGGKQLGKRTAASGDDAQSNNFAKGRGRGRGKFGAGPVVKKRDAKAAEKDEENYQALIFKGDGDIRPYVRAALKVYEELAIDAGEHIPKLSDVVP